MFREMRRRKQEIPREICERVLRGGSFGVLAVQGDGGYPYAVPVNYVYTDSKIYFHCARMGHKLDGIAENNRVSFCVTDQDTVFAEKYTTNYRSVIAFGRARVLQGEEEMRRPLMELALKYVPGGEAQHEPVIEKDLYHVCVVEITVEHMTGKKGTYVAQDRGACKS